MRKVVWISQYLFPAAGGALFPVLADNYTSIVLSSRERERVCESEHSRKFHVVTVLSFFCQRALDSWVAAMLLVLVRSTPGKIVPRVLSKQWNPLFRSH